MPQRPSLYTPALAERILSELRAGRAVAEICHDGGMPCRDTVFEWIRQDREGFAARYRQARETGHGRPGYVGYAPEIAEAVLASLMAGRTLSEVCAEPGMPGLTAVNRWIATDRDGFAARYRAARQVGQRRQAEVGYSEAAAEAVLAALMAGQALRDACADPDMPSTSAVQNWLRADRNNFRARYLEARAIGCLMISDDILKIVDDRDNDWITRQREDGSIETVLDPERVRRAALRARTRCGLLDRFMPNILGDWLGLAARQDGHGAAARGASAAELAELMRLIDGRSRGLPSEDTPLHDVPEDED